MEGKPFCVRLEDKIRECRTETKRERDLLGLVSEGLELITPDSPCLIRYYYDWAYEKEPDFPPVGLDTQIMLAYSNNDMLAENMESYFNSDCRETYAITPVTYMYLTPETDRLFRMDDYPERLFQIKNQIKMNELTKKMQEIMVPKAALIAYEYRESAYATGKNYLELRPINKAGRMEAGIPVTYEFMNALVESYSDERQNVPHGRLPSNMLWCDTRKGHEKYIWYNPPGKRRMFFKDSLNIKDGVFHLPGVVYIIENERMTIFAYKGRTPEEDTPLYLAPFFNVTRGSVCLGSSPLVNPENMDFHALQEYWEKRFWLSEFSHLGGSENPTRGNLVSVTEQARERPFNNDELKPANKQLKDILS